ncbi:TetR family transcriptional regulator [Alteromonas sp. ASW11-19]|uniref:TetR family transcriptional regulator n=1 Tax=Alteromonas salexigens TaxID=2982530 RepID=A0ABT2VPD2_9ALTE|nr:TetR family transcriptional regulator [Alteromonas salexigens]MCU7554753.1 TetR family transcriptional regulator [Alteromonas salexigens]
MRRTKAEAEQTRQAILDAAVEVFSERGVAKSTLENIAQAADVTRGAVYWHFKNKQEIFDALHDRLHTPFIQKILEGLEGQHPDPVAQLQIICTQVLVDLFNEPDSQRVLTLFLLKCDYSGDLAASKTAFNEKKRRTSEVFTAYFEKALAAGKLPADANPAILTRALNCYFRGIVVEFLDEPEGFDLAREAPMLMDMFFRPLRTASAAS